MFMGPAVAGMTIGEVMEGSTTDRGALARLLRLAGPVVLARIGIMTMGLCDSIVVGRNSSAELAYLQLGLSPVSVVLVTLIGLLFGIQVVAARHVGEGAPARAGAVLRRGVVYALVLGLASAAALHFGAPLIMSASRLTPDLAGGGARVAAVLAISVVPHAVATACSFWMEGLARPVPGMIAMLVANLVNLGANLILVPRYGAEGSAWATVASRFALLAFLGGYILLWRGGAAYGVRAPEPDGADAARKQREIGYGGGASSFVEMCAFASMTLYAGWLGGLGVATWGIVLNTSAMIFMVPLGLAAATGVLVGQAYGARDRAALVRAGRLGFTVCTVVTLAISLGVAFGARQIAEGYTRDPLLVAAVTPALLLATLFFVADGLQVVGAQALRARGDVIVPTVTHTLSYALFMLPLGYILTFTLGWGMDGILWSVIAASLLAAGFLIARFALLARRPLA